MVVIERRLAQLIPYRTIFFPNDDMVSAIVDKPSLGWLVRLFWTPAIVERARCVIRHERSSTLCIDLHRPTDRIWNGFSKSCRYDIRQGENKLSSVYIARNEERAGVNFLELYNAFALSKGDIPTITASALQRYEGYRDTFIAYLNGTAICGHIFLRDTVLRRARLLFSASKRFEDPEIAKACGLVNRFLHWREIRTYQSEGFEIFDFGGIREDQKDGITRFKMSFGGEILAENTYLCAGTPRLVRMIRGIYDSAILPARWARN